LPDPSNQPSGNDARPAGLTCDRMVTYLRVMTDDRVFKALADPTRRLLLDRLFVQDGRTLSDLESDVDMTRFGVMKHLRLLEEAGLVITRKSGREKLHFLNVVPIRLIHDRWIDKYTEPQVAQLTALKTELELPMTTAATAMTVQVHRVFIKATPQAIWDAITKPEWSTRSARWWRPTRRTAWSRRGVPHGWTSRPRRSPTRSRRGRTASAP
jgi:DNA-binding transcriptional ArsR family regulator